MNTINIIGLRTILITILIFTLVEKVYAVSGVGYMGPGPTPHIEHVLIVPPKPPGWPQMWLAADVIKSFNENGLIVEKTKKEKGIELSSLPAKVKDVVKFSVISSKQKLEGCVFEFDKKKEFDKVKSYYLALNNNGQLHTWSLIKDNILLVIDGSMSDQEIRKYENVLAGMK